MPVHDWSRVEAGIFHHFHHSWIEEIQRTLNSGLLPAEYYALAEQHTAGFGPDVLTLQAAPPATTEPVDAPPTSANRSTLLLDPPKVRATAETEIEFYRRKQKVVAVRHVSDDEVIAVVEVVSPGNKAGRSRIRAFVEKAAALLDQQIHLLILDVHRPGPRDPNGIHGVIWEEICDQAYTAPADEPLTLVAYESSLTVRAYVEPRAVGDALSDMPLFLEPGAHVLLPLEATYQRAFNALPLRWRDVLEGKS